MNTIKPYLSLCFFFIILSCHAADKGTLTWNQSGKISDNNKNTCDNWLKQAVTDIESVHANKRYIKSLQVLSTACDGGVPDKLKQAAAKTLKAKSENERFSILMKATANYYRSACFDIQPGKPAEKLFDFCLGDDYPDGPYSGMLSNVDASAYLYGKAIEIELKQAAAKSVFKDTPENKLYLQKIMLNYFLGASLYYEEHKQQYK